MKKEIESIKERNKRVEIDKAWETSRTRRVIIAAMTYIFIVTFLWTINIPKLWLNALIPTIGFLLSTSTLPFIKRWWVESVYKKE